MTTDLSRRSVAKGAAWAVPAVAVASAAPALAASTPVTVGGTVCKIFSGNGTQTTQNEQVFLGIVATGTVIPKGTVITWTFRGDLSSTYPDGASGVLDAPNLSYTPSANWTLTSSSPAGTTLASGKGSASFVVTWTAVNDVASADVACIMSANWPGTAGQNDPQLSPGATLTVTSTTAGPSNVNGQPASLSWQTPRRNSTSARSNHPRRYLSKSGTSQCYPVTQYGSQGGATGAQSTNGSQCGDGLNNSSTIYPDGTCAFVKISGGQAAVPEKC